MKLTRASSYALHAVAYMSQQKSDRPVASHKIAQERGIPERFLLKVLKPLVSARVLASVKGPNGGYRLARAPAEVTMLEVVEAVDGPMQGGRTDTRRDNLDQRIDMICRDVTEKLRRQLDKVHITELTGKGNGTAR